MKSLFKLSAFAAAFLSVFACNKIEAPQVNNAPDVPVTKALGDKTPIVAVYVETNDVNPLNAGDYYFEDTGESFIDIVELFAANIHKDNAGNPTLYLNDKLTPVLENGGVEKYVRPLQDNYGIKVLLTVLGDWQEIGVANMTNTQADQFAAILAYVVEKYGLDGIGFDDEYADYPWFGSGAVNNTSYSRIITTLRSLMPDDKLITVFDWGNTNTINTAAASCIDYAYHGYFGDYRTSSNITGMNKTRWSPVSLNLGENNSTSTVQDYASRAKNEGYGAMMCFNLRPSSDRDPLPVFQALSDGAYGGRTVACDDGDRSRDAGSVSTGYTISYSDVQ